MTMEERCRATISSLQEPLAFVLRNCSLHNRYLHNLRPSTKGFKTTILVAISCNDRLGTYRFISRKNNNFICLSYRWDDEEIAADSEGDSFEVGVFLFNSREYYRCHDVFERLWNHAEEPQRTLLHGVLQCSVGFYHLFNQNHHGAMVELGEGLTKLQKLKFKRGPFHQFEKDISTVLEFIYDTQMELAACTDDYCLTMDGSAQSYQLLGNFGAGQTLYEIQRDSENECYIFFKPRSSSNSDDLIRVKLPVLHATEEDLKHSEKY